MLNYNEIYLNEYTFNIGIIYELSRKNSGLRCECLEFLFHKNNLVIVRFVV